MDSIFGLRPGFPAGLRVLVVDEGAGASQAVAQLEALNYKATKCLSVAEALTQTVLTPAPDVCLLEAKFIRAAAPGGLSFKQALDWLMEQRASSPTGQVAQVLQLMSRVPTVLTSVDDSPDVIIGSVKAGAVDFVCKPLPEAKLKTIWQHVIRNPKVGAAAPPVAPIGGLAHAQGANAGSPGCLHTHSDGTQPSGSNDTLPAHHLAGHGSHRPTRDSGELVRPHLEAVPETGASGMGRVLPGHVPVTGVGSGGVFGGMAGHLGGALGKFGGAVMPAGMNMGGMDGMGGQQWSQRARGFSMPSMREGGRGMVEHDMGVLQMGATPGAAFHPSLHDASHHVPAAAFGTVPDLADLTAVLAAHEQGAFASGDVKGPLGLRLKKSDSFVNLVQGIVDMDDDPGMR